MTALPQDGPCTDVRPVTRRLAISRAPRRYREVGGWLAGTYIPERYAFAALRSRGSGSRALLFALECALGIVAVILVAAFAHWSGWLLPVAVLLYLLIVVPTALLCGFWQAVVV
jgi:hypothetical protein